MKAVSLLSGGIDSPVALYIMAKRMECIAVHMNNEPFGGGEGKKVMDMANIINKKMKIYTVPFGRIIQKEIYECCEERYRCVVCKRMMYRVAEKIGRAEGADVITTGENLGQVASQTLQNLMVLEESVDMPVVRPLIGLDKEEIIDIAKRIGTYEISIKKAAPCLLVPRKPSTSADLDKIHLQEKKMDFRALVEKAVGESKMEKL
jgi:thiamine biosynthesis protein ThiI